MVFKWIFLGYDRLSVKFLATFTTGCIVKKYYEKDRVCQNSSSQVTHQPQHFLSSYPVSSVYLTNAVSNKSFTSGEFPDCLKQANVSPIFKKDDSLNKENYRPVSILLLLSKVYEKLLYNRLSDYVENIFNVILCGFRKAHSTQHALFKLLQSWQKD